MMTPKDDKEDFKKVFLGNIETLLQGYDSNHLIDILYQRAYSKGIDRGLEIVKKLIEREKEPIEREREQDDD